MKKLFTTLLVVAAAGVGVWYLVKGGGYKPGTSPTPTPTVSVTKTPTPKVSTLPTPTPSVAAPSPSSSPSPELIIQETKMWNVSIQNFKYDPSPLTVKKGDIVIFKNFDSATHTVTALNKFFDSKNIRSGDQWTLATANLPAGTYEYQCTLHPSMRGTIVVQ